MVNGKKKVVAVGMSGGVDSTATAAILKEQGFEVIGITMQLYTGKPAPAGYVRRACFDAGEEASLAAAAQACREVGIPHYIINCAAAFREKVLEPVRNAYRAGVTPNPCIICNRYIKFKGLVDAALASGLDFEYFATGHYARLEHLENDPVILRRGDDERKDQSYFLARIEADSLKRVLFPLAAYTKNEVREIAARFNLSAAKSGESQDFVPNGELSSLFTATDMRPGPITDKEGRKLGMHNGIVNYTIGQRHGLRVAAGYPVYVTAIDAAANRVVVGPGEDLLSATLTAGEVNWLLPAAKAAGRGAARIRHNHRPAACTYQYDGGKLTVNFSEPQRAITPGQTVVVYEDDRVVAAGVIE